MRTEPRSLSTSSLLYGRTTPSHRDAMDAGVLTSVGPRPPCAMVVSFVLAAEPFTSVGLGSAGVDCRFESGYAADMDLSLVSGGSVGIGLSSFFRRAGSQKLVS